MPGESIRERLSALSRAELVGLVAVLAVTLGGAGLWYVRSLPRPVEIARARGATAARDGSPSRSRSDRAEHKWMGSQPWRVRICGGFAWSILPGPQGARRASAGANLAAPLRRDAISCRAKGPGGAPLPGRDDPGVAARP
jgi:hypothetical protein